MENLQNPLTFQELEAISTGHIHSSVPSATSTYYYVVSHNAKIKFT